MTILYTSLLTLVVTVLAGLVLDFVRNARPRVVYSVKNAVFIELEDSRRIGAYVVSLRNTSKRVVKDLECYLDAPPAKLRNGGISAPQGMQYSVAESDDSLRFTAPYLNRDEAVTITVIAEVRLYAPAPYQLSVAIRSPHELKVVQAEPDARPRGFIRGFYSRLSLRGW